MKWITSMLSTNLEKEPDLDFFAKLSENLECESELNFFKFESSKPSNKPEPKKTHKKISKYELSNLSIGILVSIPIVFGTALMVHNQPPKADYNNKSSQLMEKRNDFKPLVIPQQKEINQLDQHQTVVDTEGLSYKGNPNNMKKEDFAKMQDFQNKLMSNNLSEKDIASTVNTLQKMQKDYYGIK